MVVSPSLEPWAHPCAFAGEIGQTSLTYIIKIDDALARDAVERDGWIAAGRLARVEAAFSAYNAGAIPRERNER
jgi:hypothetical protein